MKIELVNPTFDMLEHIAANMNPRDADEIMASGGFAPLPGLIEAVRYTPGSQIALCDGEPQAAFGASKFPKGGACPWLLATRGVLRWRKQFMRLSRQIVQHWLDEHGLLVNFIDARNRESIAWLHALGFQFTDCIERFGVAGVPFLQFEKSR